jgi:hypothetical protein
MRTVSRWFAVIGILSLILSIAFVQAQDEATPEATAEEGTTSSGMVTCDSDLILLLYVAERYFGFSALRNQMMSSGGDTSNMVDLATLDRGQFTPLFGSMNSMMDENMMMPGQTMTEEDMSGRSTMMMDDAAMMEQMRGMVPEGTDPSTMTTLGSGTMADEATECSSLRSELRRFYTALVAQDMSTGMGMNTGVGAEATTEANAEATAEATTESGG